MIADPFVQSLYEEALRQGETELAGYFRDHAQLIAELATKNPYERDGTTTIENPFQYTMR